MEALAQIKNQINENAGKNKLTKKKLRESIKQMIQVIIANNPSMDDRVIKYVEEMRELEKQHGEMIDPYFCSNCGKKSDWTKVSIVKCTDNEQNVECTRCEDIMIPEELWED